VFLFFKSILNMKNKLTLFFYNIRLFLVSLSLLFLLFKHKLLFALVFVNKIFLQLDFILEIYLTWNDIKNMFSSYFEVEFIFVPFVLFITFSRVQWMSLMWRSTIANLFDLFRPKSCSQRSKFLVRLRPFVSMCSIEV